MEYLLNRVDVNVQGKFDNADKKSKLIIMFGVR
jgi:hypothetical protein